MERKFDGIATGIDGLDNILDGGIPLMNSVLIAGGPGTGKTTMAFEILLNCAKEKIQCAFITLDEKPESVIRNAEFITGKADDIQSYIRDNVLVVDGGDSAAKVATNTESETGYTMSNLISDIEGIIKSVDAKVVAIDSLSFLKLMLGKTLLYNKSVSSLLSNLRRLGVTSIITLELPYYQHSKMKFGQELLLFDGVIALYQSRVEDKNSFEMQVVKMRGNSHERAITRYNITDKGVKFE
ncbi:MAG: ATPase domain-containing protein [Candidatus Micrarchaeaceae archaeon]